MPDNTPPYTERYPLITSHEQAEIESLIQKLNKQYEEYKSLKFRLKTSQAKSEIREKMKNERANIRATLIDILNNQRIKAFFRNIDSLLDQLNIIPNELQRFSPEYVSNTLAKAKEKEISNIFNFFEFLLKKMTYSKPLKEKVEIYKEKLKNFKKDLLSKFLKEIRDNVNYYEYLSKKVEGLKSKITDSNSILTYDEINRIKAEYETISTNLIKFSGFVKRDHIFIRNYIGTTLYKIDPDVEVEIERQYNRLLTSKPDTTLQDLLKRPPSRLFLEYNVPALLNHALHDMDEQFKILNNNARSYQKQHIRYVTDLFNKISSSMTELETHLSNLQFLQAQHSKTVTVESLHMIETARNMIDMREKEIQLLQEKIRNYFPFYKQQAISVQSRIRDEYLSYQIDVMNEFLKIISSLQKKIEDSFQLLITTLTTIQNSTESFYERFSKKEEDLQTLNADLTRVLSEIEKLSFEDIAEKEKSEILSMVKKAFPKDIKSDVYKENPFVNELNKFLELFDRPQQVYEKIITPVKTEIKKQLNQLSDAIQIYQGSHIDTLLNDLEILAKNYISQRTKANQNLLDEKEKLIRLKLDGLERIYQGMSPSELLMKRVKQSRDLFEKIKNEMELALNKQESDLFHELTTAISNYTQCIHELDTIKKQIDKELIEKTYNKENLLQYEAAINKLEILKRLKKQINSVYGKILDLNISFDKNADYRNIEKTYQEFAPSLADTANLISQEEKIFKLISACHACIGYLDHYLHERRSKSSLFFSSKTNLDRTRITNEINNELRFYVTCPTNQLYKNRLIDVFKKVLESPNYVARREFLPGGEFQNSLRGHVWRIIKTLEKQGFDASSLALSKEDSARFEKARTQHPELDKPLMLRLSSGSVTSIPPRISKPN